MAVWRLQVNTGGKNISKYCMEHHVAAMGWSLDGLSDSEREQIGCFQDYCDLAKNVYDSFDSVCRLAEDVKENDLIWMRSEGKYYIARVSAESKWQFCNDAVDMDASNQLSHIDWYPATQFADEDSVPGAVATAFIMGSTLQRIRKTGIEAYSMMLYNHVSDKTKDSFLYPKPQLSLNENNFYSLLQPEDVEDLLCMWLYDEKGYICIPSTNKTATPKYECVLLDPKDGKHIYIQVKKGSLNLDANEYKDLAGEVYLLTTEGNVSNTGKYDNIFTVNPTDIFEFAINPNHSNLVPENVRLWIKFLSELKNSERTVDNVKGNSRKI